MNTFAVVFLSLVSLAFGGVVDFYKPCGTNNVGHISKIEVEPCSGNPCEFPIGGNVTVHVTFTSDSPIISATPKVYAYIIFKIPAPFHMEANSCSNFDQTCPIAKGQEVVYSFTVHVEKLYPSVRTVAEWQILDQDGHTVFCFGIPVHLVH